MSGTLFLCGAGNSEGVRLALATNAEQGRWDRLAVLDDDSRRRGEKLLGVEIAGGFDVLGELRPGTVEVVNLVARTTRGRARAREKIASFGHPFASLVQGSVDTGGVRLARDVTVYHNVILSPDAIVAAGSVLFMGSMVGQGARLGRGCVVAAGAGIGAGARLEDEVYVGTRAAVMPGVRVGAGATIGAASAVVSDVPPGATVVGVPGDVLMPGGAHPAATRDETACDARSRAALPPAVVAELERAIIGVWCELLGRSGVGPRDNFFDIGATSLIALRAIEPIRRATRRDLTQTDLFRFTTARSLAERLCRVPGEARAPSAGGSRAALRRACSAKRRRRLEGNR